MTDFPHGFDGFRPRFGNQDDRTPFEAKCGAHLVGQIFFVLLGKKFFAIDEKEKGGRNLFGLCGVEKLEAMAARTDGLATLNRILQSAI